MIKMLTSKWLLALGCLAVFSVAMAADPPPSGTVKLTSKSIAVGVGVTWGDGLSHLVEDDGVVVASEPYDDDPRWVDVPDRHLIEVARRDGMSRPVVTVTALES